MESIRKPFQGVTNIIRFNRHFYVPVAIAIIVFFVLGKCLPQPYRLLVYWLCSLAFFSVFISLLVSFYVYDLSALYSFTWFNKFSQQSKNMIVNIHAGFDETSSILSAKFPQSALKVFDFYNPALHTEVSIKHARLAYPPYHGTISISTRLLPLANETADAVFVIFAAHEIRNDNERIGFFNEINRVLRSGAHIIVIEHLRDLPNFIAYNIGFFHFLSKATWFKTFKAAGIQVSEEIKINPFVNAFILTKHETAA